jgi:hypothetical protein
VSPSAEQVLPSFPPREILPGEVLERGTVDEVIEAPPGSDVTDDQDALTLPAHGQVAEEPADPRHGLIVTSPARGSLDAAAAE